MNRLVLALGIVCLLQGLSAEPKPEFGLTNTFSGTARITVAKTEAKTTVDAVKALVVPAITSGFAALSTTKTQIEKVITDFDAKAQDIFGGYDTLVAAVDGDINAAFDAFIVPIDAALTYLANDAPTITSALGGISYTGISEELTDAFGRIGEGLTALKAKANTVKSALLAAQTDTSAGATTIDAAVLRKNLPLSKIYDLVRAASDLKAYLPLVKYILTTTIENIKEAEDFLGKLKTALNTDTPTEAAKFTSDIKTLVSSIKSKVADDFKLDDNDAQVAVDAFGALTTIKSAPKYNDLQAVINTLDNLFAAASLDSKATAMGAALDQISTKAEALVTSLQSQVDVPTNPLVKLLIDTLLGNNKYGRYCYNKYKDLVFGLFGQSFDNSYECADKEYERLDYLKTTLGLLIELMSADYEDIKDQLDVCEKITSTDNRDNCVASLATYYKLVYEATQEKINVVYEFAKDEAVASENRLLICFQLAYFEGSVTSPEEISEDLKNCATDGPAGTKE